MMKLTLTAVAVIAMLSVPARADITVKSQDGTMELTLPNGWHELKPQGAETQIVATDGHGGHLAVRSFSKEDFKDMKAVAGFSVTRLKLVEKPEQKFQDVDVNGKPGVRLELMGTEPNGMKRGFIITVFDAGTQFIDVVATAKASVFSKDQEVLGAFAKQIALSGSAAGKPPAASPTATSSPPQAPQPETPQPKPPRRR